MSCCSAGCTASAISASLVFIDLRDRHGVTQVVARVDETLIADAKRLRSEFVVARHRARSSIAPPETVNPKIATGEIEVTAREFRLLNEAKTPPFMIADEIEVTEETRLSTATSICGGRGCSAT